LTAEFQLFWNSNTYALMLTLSESDIESVQDSFARLLQSSQPVGPQFYAHLFAAHPEVRPLFKADPAEQSEKFITMLSYIVSCLDNLDELDAVLQELGKRHMAYKAEPSHYPAVKVALAKTIRELDTDADDVDEVVSAWDHFYDLIAAKMLIYGQ
jgi:hemoglobin-like flavoprotein